MNDHAIDLRAEEVDAIRADAEQRLRELRRVRAVLWPDRDDPEVMSELTTVQSAIRHAERALQGGR